MNKSLSSITLVLAAFLTLLAQIGLLQSASAKIPLSKYSKKPKLVVTIVIDQCRSDFLTRFEKRMRAQKGGGLSYLMNHGAYFPFAKYDILQSMTCPGHATILTGAYPYQTGIPLNEWYDAGKKTDVNCAEDRRHAIVGRVGAKPEEGISPHRLGGSTVGDELKIAGYKSKVVAIALKDRSAVMLGGHRADLALWEEEGQWVSSDYYLPDGTLPAWVADLNSALAKEKGSILKWKFAGEPSGLTAVDAKPANGKKGAVPRDVIAGSPESFSTPYGVRVTTDAAIRALKELKLGQGSAPDMLLVSYSTHDMLGHAVGLQARAMEEITMFEDESIGALIKAVDQAVGLKNVIFAFTGDHGVAPSVEVVKPQKMPAGRIDQNALVEEANQVLNEKFGKSSKGPWVLRAKSFNFYLDPEVLSDRKKSRIEVEAALKHLILKPMANGEVGRDGVAQVFTRGEWDSRTLPPGRFQRQILKTYLPGKSGDVVLIPKPFWVDKGTTAATHLTGYNYDRVVPLIIAGENVKSGVYAEEAEVIDLAPTLSFMLGLVPPSGSDGRVLHEIF